MDRRIYLSETNKKSAVYAAVSRIFWDRSTIIRILWVLTVFLDGIGLLAYFIAWIVMPRRNRCKYNNW